MCDHVTEHETVSTLYLDFKMRISSKKWRKRAKIN